MGKKIKIIKIINFFYLIRTGVSHATVPPSLLLIFSNTQQPLLDW